MRKLLSLGLVMAIFLTSCGDAGIETDVSKISSLDFDISASGLNTVTGITTGMSFNFSSEEFASYAQDAEKFSLNKLEMTVSDVDGTPATTLDIAIRIDFGNNTASSTDGDELLTVANIAVANISNPILLYSTDASNPGIANATVVQALEQAVLNGNSVEVEITTSKNGMDLTDDFKVTMLFDLTARLQLD